MFVSDVKTSKYNNINPICLRVNSQAKLNRKFCFRKEYDNYISQSKKLLELRRI